MALFSLNARPRRPDGEDIVDIVALLQACHGRIRGFLSTARIVASMPMVPVTEIASAAAAVQRYFAIALPLHIADEDLTVLPRLLGRDPAVDAALAAMATEHVEHGADVAQLIVLCAALAETPQRVDQLAAQLGGVVERLEATFAPHLIREERVVFPAIGRLLSDDDRAAMLGELRARRDTGAGAATAAASSVRPQ